MNIGFDKYEPVTPKTWTRHLFAWTEAMRGHVQELFPIQNSQYKIWAKLQPCRKMRRRLRNMPTTMTAEYCGLQRHKLVTYCFPLGDEGSKAVWGKTYPWNSWNVFSRAWCWDHDEAIHSLSVERRWRLAKMLNWSSSDPSSPEDIDSPLILCPIRCQRSDGASNTAPLSLSGSLPFETLQLIRGRFEFETNLGVSSSDEESDMLPSSSFISATRLLSDRTIKGGERPVIIINLNISINKCI